MNRNYVIRVDLLYSPDARLDHPVSKSGIFELFITLIHKVFMISNYVNKSMAGGENKNYHPNIVVFLEWTFSPPDYFGLQIEIKQSDYDMIIADGKVIAKINSAIYDANPSIRNLLHEELKCRFLAHQLCIDKTFKLSGLPSPDRLYPNGRREISLSGKIETKSSVNIEFQIFKEGVVIADSRRDRIKKVNDVTDLFIKHWKDKTLKSLLKSHNESKNDPNNEFTHLYEIRDALSSKFGNSDKARTALNISKRRWSDFGSICNNEPLKQGRHRGEHETLRDATPEELAEVRRTAKEDDRILPKISRIATFYEDMKFTGR